MFFGLLMLFAPVLGARDSLLSCEDIAVNAILGALKPHMGKNPWQAMPRDKDLQALAKLIANQDCTRVAELFGKKARMADTAKTAVRRNGDFEYVPSMCDAVVETIGRITGSGLRALVSPGSVSLDQREMDDLFEDMIKESLQFTATAISFLVVDALRGEHAPAVVKAVGMIAENSLLALGQSKNKDMADEVKKMALELTAFTIDPLLPGNWDEGYEKATLRCTGAGLPLAVGEMSSIILAMAENPLIDAPQELPVEVMAFAAVGFLFAYVVEVVGIYDVA